MAADDSGYDGGGFDWNGLSDFIYSVEGPTLGVLSLAKGGSVSQGADGSLSAAANSNNGTFAGPGAVGTGQATALAADVSSQVISTAPLAALAARPGVLLVGLALLVGVIAIAKS